MRTITISLAALVLLAVALALFSVWGALNTAQASDTVAPSMADFCLASEAMAQYGRRAAIGGFQDEEIAYVTANFTGQEKVLALKVLDWGFAFYSSSADQLRDAFLISCLDSNPYDMPAVDQR